MQQNTKELMTLMQLLAWLSNYVNNEGGGGGIGVNVISALGKDITFLYHFSTLIYAVTRMNFFFFIFLILESIFLFNFSQTTIEFSTIKVCCILHILNTFVTIQCTYVLVLAQDVLILTFIQCLSSLDDKIHLHFCSD